jgi:hypothetical protein
MSSVRETILSIFYKLYAEAGLGFNFYSAQEGSVDPERVIFHPAVLKMKPGQLAGAAMKYGDDGLVVMTKFGPIVLFIVQPGYETTRRVSYCCEPSFADAAGFGDFPCPYNLPPVESAVDGKIVQYSRVKSVAMMERILTHADVDTP